MKHGSKYAYFCRIGLLVLYVWAGSVRLGAQVPTNTDSIENLLKKAHTDSALGYIYDALAREYGHTDPEKGLVFGRKGLYYNHKSKIARYELDAFNTLGMMHRVMGNYDSSLFYHNKALKLALDRKLGDKQLEKVYSFLNLTYTEQGNYTAGLEYGFKFLAIIEREKDSFKLAMACNNIANTYFQLDQFDKALKYYYRSLQMAMGIHHVYGIALLTSNIGSVYHKQGKFDSAMVYFRKALQMSFQIGDETGIGVNYSNIASNFDRAMEYDSSLFYYKKALERYEKLGLKPEISSAYYNISTVYLNRKIYPEALNNALKALKYAEETGSLSHLESAHLSLKNIYSGMGNTGKALFHFEKYIDFRDSLFNEESSNAQYREEIDYEYSRKKYTDSLEQVRLKSINAQVLKAEQDKSAWRQTLAYGAGIAFLLMLGLSVFIYRGYRDKKRAHIVISEQKAHVEFQKMEIEQKNREIIDSINYARRIQEAILPSAGRIRNVFPQSFVFYLPKDIVAGDFYWMEIANEAGGGRNEILFAAADCTGHGVPGAMVSVVCHNALNRSLREFGLTDPGKLLDKTRELVIEHFESGGGDVKDGMDISLASLELRMKNEELKMEDEGSAITSTSGHKPVLPPDTYQTSNNKSQTHPLASLELKMKNEELKMANAQPATLNSQLPAVLRWSGANNPLWIIADREDLGCHTEKVKHAMLPIWLHEIKADKQPIGVYTEMKPFTTHTVNLKHGDRIYIFTDGFADQFGGEKGKKFKASNFKELLLGMNGTALADQEADLLYFFEKWRAGLEQVDDICIMGIQL